MSRKQTEIVLRDRIRTTEEARCARDERQLREMAASIRVLLDGVCGINIQHISKATGLCRMGIMKFMAGTYTRETVDRLGLFVWMRLNRHVLLTDEEVTPEGARTHRGAFGRRIKGDRE